MPKKNHNLRVIRGDGKTNIAKIERVVFVLTILLVFAVLVQTGYHWTSEWIYSRRVQMEVAEPSKFRVSEKAGGVITRKEEVVGAPREGYFVSKVSSGKRIPVGKKVGRFILPEDEAMYLPIYSDSSVINAKMFRGFVLPEWVSLFEEYCNILDRGNVEYLLGTNYYSHKSGVISFRVDGWEEYSPPNFPYQKMEEKGVYADNHDDAKLTKEKDLDDTGLEHSFVKKEDPLFKIVNNWEWHFSVILDEDTGQNIAAQDKVEIEFAFAPEQVVEAEKIHQDVDILKGKVYLTYRLEKDLPGVSDIRKTWANIYYQEYQGLKVPKQAIANEEEKGVYVNKGGVVNFEPVNVLYRHEGVAVIEGIEDYSMVISNPELVEEGQKLE